MKCCATCFGDRGLRKEIIPLRSKELGTCPRCGTPFERLVDPHYLTDYFELLVGIYSPSENGKPLVKWLREDWALFSHPKFDDAQANNLLAEILINGPNVYGNFEPSELSRTDRLDRWEKLRDELMYENRFFPKAEIDRARFEALLSRLILDQDEILSTWYRARIQGGDTPFAIKEMGEPPKRLATHGRANPAGIPYLYLSSNPETAVAEIRPHTGELACVADFAIAHDLKIVDLRNPRKQISPFLLSDEREIALLRGDIKFLERLGNELTRPVLPQSAAIDYIPSQYLCEFIKKCGYHGVIYRSSVSDGMNLALFDPARAKAGKVKQYEVSRVKIRIAPFPTT